VTDFVVFSADVLAYHFISYSSVLLGYAEPWGTPNEISMQLIKVNSQTGATVLRRKRLGANVKSLIFLMLLQGSRRVNKYLLSY
jgi:hypothetical protein